MCDDATCHNVAFSRRFLHDSFFGRRVIMSPILLPERSVQTLVNVKCFLCDMENRDYPIIARNYDATDHTLHTLICSKRCAILNSHIHNVRTSTRLQTVTHVLHIVQLSMCLSYGKAAGKHFTFPHANTYRHKYAAAEGAATAGLHSLTKSHCKKY